MQQHLAYRPAVSIIVHREDEFLIINRYSDEPHKQWKFPQGGVEEHDEDLVAAGLREFAEELGTDELDVLGVSQHENRYDWDEEGIRRHEEKTGRTYAGQHQRFVVARFTGTEQDLDLCDEEVRAHRWVSREDVIQYNRDGSHDHFSHYNGLISAILEEFDL